VPDTKTCYWPIQCVVLPPRIDVRVYNVQASQIVQRGRQEPRFRCCVACTQYLKSIVSHLSRNIESKESESPDANRANSPPKPMYPPANLLSFTGEEALGDISRCTAPHLSALKEHLSIDQLSQPARALEGFPKIKSALSEVEKSRNHQTRREKLNLYRSFKPLRNLKSLYLLLIKFFQGKEIATSDLQALSFWEVEILGLVVRRKYSSESALFSFPITEIAQSLDFLACIQRKLPSKRPEEIYKFVFTRAIKYLKMVFRGNNMSGTDNHDSELKFYQHYFEPIARKNNLSLEKFLYPLNKKEKSGWLRSPNFNYFRLVFMSETFAADIVQYATKVMPSEHQDELRQKALSILRRWDGVVNGVEAKSPAGNKLKAELMHYFLKNKRCKLPWTLTEINNAIEKLYELLRKLKVEPWEPSLP